jgi:hypothetical protein
LRSSLRVADRTVVPRRLRPLPVFAPRARSVTRREATNEAVLAKPPVADHPIRIARPSPLRLLRRMTTHSASCVGELASSGAARSGFGRFSKTCRLH